MRARAEDAEVVGRDHVAIDAFRAVAAAEAQRFRTEAVRIQPGEDGVARSDVEIVLI